MDRLDLNQELGSRPAALERLKTYTELRNYSDLYNLTFDPKSAAFVLSSSKDTTSKTFTGFSSDTEGRTFLLGSFSFRFIGGVWEKVKSKLPKPFIKDIFQKDNFRPVVLGDYIEKGGGVNDNLQPRGIDSTSNTATPRYYRSLVMGRNEKDDPPMGAVYDSDSRLDELASLAVHSWGGRTRLPIVVFDLPELQTPDGKLNQEKAFSLGYIANGENTVLTHWGMRFRFRLDDLITQFAGSKWKSTDSLSGYLLGATGIHPGVERYDYKKQPDTEVAHLGLVYAQEVIRRCETDDNPDWKQLHIKYKDMDESRLSDFYLDYLSNLTTTLGGELGRLFNHKAYISLFNLQNISGLCEVVDLDNLLINMTKYVDGSNISRESMVKRKMITEEEAGKGIEPNESRLHARLVFSAIEQLTFLYSVFRNNGLINTDSVSFKQSYDQAMKGFGVNFAQEAINIKRPASIQRYIKLVKGLENEFNSEESGGLWPDFKNPLVEGGKSKVPIFSRLFDKIQRTNRPLVYVT